MEINNLFLTDEQWEKVYGMLDTLGLYLDDCLSSPALNRILLNRIAEVTGTPIEYMEGK